MTFINWDNKKFSVGDAEMDEQHQKLVALLNELHDIHSKDSIQKPINPEQVKDVILKLLAYTQLHFEEEELLMTKINYPHTTKHKLAHQTLCKQIDYLHSEFDRVGIIVIPKLLAFLGVWLQGHILSMDKDYAEFTATCDKNSDIKFKRA